MTDSYGFVVCKRLPNPRAQHPWIYVPISAVSFDLGKVQRCYEGLIDPKRKKPPFGHEDADGYVLTELTAVSLEKPPWPVLEQPVNARDRVNERLAEIIDLDQEIAHA